MSRTTKTRLIRIQPIVKWVALVSLAFSAVNMALTGNWFAAVFATLAGIWAWIAFASQKITHELLEHLAFLAEPAPSQNLRADVNEVRRLTERQRSGGAL